MAWKDLRESRILAYLDEDDLKALAPALLERYLHKDQVLFKQGQAGDSMFIVLKGELDVLARARNHPVEAELPVARLSPGDVVGELTCLDPSARAATVRAASTARVIEISCTMLDSLTQHAPVLGSRILRGIATRIHERLRVTHQQIDELLQRCDGTASMRPQARPLTAGKHEEVCHSQVDLSPLVSIHGLSQADLELLRGSSRIIVFKAGAALCLEGETATSCMFVLEGNLELSHETGGRVFALARLGPGSIVGQAGLLERQPRMATMRAISRCVVMRLDRDTFEQLMRLGKPFAVRFQHDMAVAGAQQLRLTTRRLLILRGLAPANEVKNPAPARRRESRARVETADQVLEAAMRQSNLDLSELDAVEIVELPGQLTQRERRKRRTGS